jgi:hypothetical protein
VPDEGLGIEESYAVRFSHDTDGPAQEMCWQGLGDLRNNFPVELLV